MASSITFNPNQTTNAQNSFSVESTGYVQGAAQDDPVIRNLLAGGILASTETLPMWGGVAIMESMPSGNDSALGSSIARADTNAHITGFTVLNQMHSWVTSPQSPVPLASSGMGVAFYRIGSNARIAVACSPTLVDLEGNLINSQVSWDLVNQMLVPYTPGYSAITITGAVWASTNGGQTTFTVSTNPTTLIFPGDNILVSGVVNTGGSSTSAFDGTFVVVSTTSTTVVVTQAATSSPGTYSSGGTINAAQGGALNARVLHVNIGNSKIVTYNPTTGFATWNDTGSAAIILI